MAIYPKKKKKKSATSSKVKSPSKKQRKQMSHGCASKDTLSPGARGTTKGSGPK